MNISINNLRAALENFLRDFLGLSIWRYIWRQFENQFVCVCVYVCVMREFEHFYFTMLKFLTEHNNKTNLRVCHLPKISSLAKLATFAMTSFGRALTLPPLRTS